MEGRGTIIFSKNVSAAVDYRFNESGRGNVWHATGHPYWADVVLLHRGPFTLVTADGHKSKVFLLSTDGLAQMAGDKTVAHFCNNSGCRCEVIDPKGAWRLNPPCPRCGRQMFTTRVVEV